LFTLVEEVMPSRIPGQEAILALGAWAVMLAGCSTADVLERPAMGVQGVPPGAGAGGAGGTAGVTQLTGGVGGNAGAAGSAVGDAAVPVVDGGGGMGGVPAPPAFAIVVPPYEQPAGDPDRGYDYLINGDYQRLGPDLAAFKATAPPIADADRLPGRRGANADLSYMFNAVTSPDGTQVAGVNCLGCHATQLQGKLIVGLGRPNRMVRLNDVNVLGIAFANPLALDSSIGTLNRLLGGVALGVMDVFPYLAAHRDPKTLEWTDQQLFNPDAGVLGWVDIPPWWRTAKKNGLYSNGSGRGAQAHHMSFMSIFSVENTAEAAIIEQNFYDVAAYIRSIEPPPFPGPVDGALAATGEGIFVSECATCHGTYGESWTYPNVIIPYQEVGTDPSLATGHWMAPTVDWYAESWYAREGKSWLDMVEGYYAPPLDGIWATAPFFHNGSVPTLDGVLDPDKRPASWTSNMSADDYDLEHVGWQNKLFDTEFTLDGDNGTFNTTRPGNSNQGHTYAADLTEQEQRALLEYLKTL
jgi:mono/diheme cytochrome c family protein